MSVRATITSLVVSAIAGINTSAGYNTDFDHVYTWKVTPFDDDETSASVYDTSDDIESDDEGILHKHTLHYEIVVSLSDGATTISSVRDAIADVYTALQTSTGLTADKYRLWPQGDEINVDQSNKKVAIATIKFAVECYTDAWQQTILYS